MDHFKRLPAEITVDILSRVPTETVQECKSVSTDWNNLVSHHPSFSMMHFHRHKDSTDDSGKLSFIVLTNNPGPKRFYYVEYNENGDAIQRTRMMNITSPFGEKQHDYIDSINGLICLYVERSICICNPITKEYAMLPDSKGKSKRYSFKSMSNSTRYRFVYVSSTNEYKVVGIYPSKTTGFVKVRIFTLGGGTGWRNLGKVNSGFSSSTWTSPGVFANGALYWVDDAFNKIAIFDLAEEKFSEKKLPPPPSLYWKYSIIGDMNVSLCLNVPGDDQLFDLWILKNMKDGESFVWSKEGVFADNHGYELLTLSKSGHVIGYSPYNLSSCSIKTPIWKHLFEFKDHGVQVCLHKNTLVSLKELGKQITK